MPKTSKASKKYSTNKLQRKHVHLFETPQFKAKLQRSINENLSKMSQEGFTFPTYIPLEQLLAPCKKTRGKKGRITRPQNAFILYRKDLQEKIKDENPNADFKEISRIAGNQWKHESDQVKNNYTLLATLGGLVHQELFPNYKYQPRHKDDRKIMEEVNEEEEKEVEKEEEIALQLKEEPLFEDDTSINKPWETMPQLFIKTPEFDEYLSGIENILTSPNIIQIPQNTIEIEQPIVESQYYEPSIPLNQSPKNKSSDILNYFNEFQIDENVMNNLDNEILSSSFNSDYVLNNINDRINNSPENSNQEEINGLFIFPTVNTRDNQSETASNSSCVPVTTQVNTTIPSFYIPVYREHIAPILAINSINSDSTPCVPTQISYTDNTQHYDMGFLNEWPNEELIDNLYQR